MFVWPNRLLKSRAFLRWRRGPAEQTGGLEYAVNARRAGGHDVAVEHHVGQLPVALQWKLATEVDDGAFLRIGQPMIAGHPGVVLVDAAEPLLPVEELAATNAQPGDEPGLGQFGERRILAHVIDDLVAEVVGDPVGRQGSPRLFFRSICSSMRRAMTPSLRCSRASRASIRFWRSSSARAACRPFFWKARWPFSKSSFCQR